MNGRVDPASWLARLRDGATSCMLAVRHSRTTDIARIAASSGHDTIMVDLEHSTMSTDVAAAICATAADIGVMPFARIPERDYGIVGRLLDGGAHGIIAPRIETAESAADLARACRFPPRGQRSQLSSVPAVGMRPQRASELNPMLDAMTVVGVLIETPLGVQHAAEIASVDGVDLVAIGVNDLTAELGSPGDVDHPDLAPMIHAVAEACRTAGTLCQLGGVDDITFARLRSAGICNLRLTGTDTELLFRAAAARVDAVTPREDTPDG